MDAAHAAGASYADARLTRLVVHEYCFFGPAFIKDSELVGIGVRALLNGYWGFAASTICTPEQAVRLAQDAVHQARANATTTSVPVDFGTIPITTGTWTTPIRIDPFTISIEEKQDYMDGIQQLVHKVGKNLRQLGLTSFLRFLREERVVATSEGGRFTQTFFESQGVIECDMQDYPDKSANAAQRAIGAMLGIGTTVVPASGIDLTAAGWELILDANVPEQILSGRIVEEGKRIAALASRPFHIGKYTLVCDGTTMARLVENTLGLATQLDRALGYEANAHGTSVVTDPLAMVGHLSLAAPLVTVTANRSAPGELGTVKWDDEGVTPEPFTLIKDGVLTDFQTTREQAAWLAPYYHQRSQPVQSHGCAASESAHQIPMQHMPNLTFEPSPSTVRTEDLVADVSDGVWIEGGSIIMSDQQARSGLLVAGSEWGGGRMRQIKNGRLGPVLTGGAVLYDTENLWKHLRAVGGASTTAVVGTSKWYSMNSAAARYAYTTGSNDLSKGEPPQLTSHSVRAAAATLPNQPLIDLGHKA